MQDTSRNNWTSRAAFIFAAVGSAVGLGNALRFPGLCAKHGGATFLLVYIILGVAIGVPLLMMELAIGRKSRRGATLAFRSLNKKLEPIGWLPTTNAFFICAYYVVMFAWIILMCVSFYKFIPLTNNSVEASQLWGNLIKTTGTTSGFGTIAWGVVICLIIAWVLIFFCIKNGTKSIGKASQITVILPILCLIILAIRGATLPSAVEGIKALFVPNLNELKDPTLWVDAFGQMFYSLSIMMCIMFAYGSFMREDQNIFADSIIIMVCDLAISVLASFVMFTTMAGTGMLGSITDQGLTTAFIVYPQAIVNLSSSGVFNSIFALVFYFCLASLAVNSAYSIVEGVATAVADKFKFNKKKTILWLCVALGVISLFFTTGAGLAFVDILDNWCNSYNLIIIGIIETLAIGWTVSTPKLCEEINKNTKKAKLSVKYFNVIVKFVAPIILTGFLGWNLYALIKSGGIYGASSNYSLLSNILGGWLVTAIVLISGFIARIIAKKLNVENEDVEIIFKKEEEPSAQTENN